MAPRQNKHSFQLRKGVKLATILRLDVYANLDINGRLFLTKRSISTLLAESLLLRSTRMLDVALNRRSLSTLVQGADM